MQLPEKLVSRDSLVARLYERHAPALFAYLRQKTASREDAEDILAQVFVAAIEQEAIAALSEREQVAWLWRVARNKSVDAYRRSRLRQGMDLEELTDLLYDENEQHAPEQVSLRREEYARLHAHIARLSPLQQKTLHLRFANELRCSEIAQVLGKREVAVRVMLSRTLNFLRGLYEKDQGGERS